MGGVKIPPPIFFNMKKLCLTLIIIVILGIVSFSFSQSLVFQEIKRLSLLAPFEQNGNFLRTSFLRDDGIQEVYLIGFFKGNIVSAVKIGKEKVVVIWVESERKYVSGTDVFGIWTEQDIDETQADNFAKHVLKKIRD
jgi:hypothetical protein